MTCSVPSALCARDAVVGRGRRAPGAPGPSCLGPFPGLRRGLILDGAFSLAVRSRELKSFTRELSQTSEWEAGKDPACRCGFQRLISL